MNAAYSMIYSEERALYYTTDRRVVTVMLVGENDIGLPDIGATAIEAGRIDAATVAATALLRWQTGRRLLLGIKLEVLEVGQGQWEWGCLVSLFPCSL
jgi:hypothetical protein